MGRTRDRRRYPGKDCLLSLSAMDACSPSPRSSATSKVSRPKSDGACRARVSHSSIVTSKGLGLVRISQTSNVKVTHFSLWTEIMIRTAVCDLLDIEHPIALGGMGSATSPALVAAVSKAGGLGALGCHYLNPAQINERAAAIRLETNKPFGLNFLVFSARARIALTQLSSFGRLLCSSLGPDLIRT